MKKNERKSIKRYNVTKPENKTLGANPAKGKSGQAESFFRYIVENSQTKITVLDEEGIIRYQNIGFNVNDFYKPEDIIGKSFLELVHPDYVQKVTNLFKDLIKLPGTVKQMQLLFRYKDGAWHSLDIRAKSMLDIPEVAGIVVNSRDITDHKAIEDELKMRSWQLENEIEEKEKAEEALRRSEEYFRAIVQNSTDIIVVVDSNATNKYISSSFEKITGHKIKDRLGKKIMELIHPEDIGKVMEGLNDVLNRPEDIHTIEVRYLHGDGTYHWFEISGMNLLKDPNVNGIVVNFRDVSERKLSEQKLKEEMEITSHLLSLSESVATITDVNKLMLEAVHASKKIMGCDIAVSYLWNKQTGVFVPSEEVDMPNDILPLFRTENIDMKHIKNFMEIKKPFLIKFTHSVLGEQLSIPVVDISIEEFMWLSLLQYIDIEEINTIIVIPLLNRDEFLGIVIGVYMKSGHTFARFTERYYKAIIGISNQVSTALEQAKLYRESVEKTMELSHRVETINTMYEIDRNILSNITSEDILNTVTRMAGKLLPCEVAVIMIVDKDKQGFNRIAGFGTFSFPIEPFFLFKDTSATEVTETGRPQYMPNLGDVQNILPLEQKLLHDGILSVMRIPLKIGDEIIGTLNFGARRASAFTHENLLTAEKLGSQISVALANAKLISDLEESSIATIKSLTNAIDAKSRWTAGHSEGVTRYAIAIGRQMGLNEKTLRDLEVGGMMHDIGKIGTYADILNKKEKLTDNEWTLIRQHPDKGVEILSPIKQLKTIISAIEHHHEFFDGSGYPDGLKGLEIPLLARILSVADAIDAMTSDRPYRKGMPKDEIIKELKKCSGSQFDPEIVKAFMSIHDILPR